MSIRQSIYDAYHAKLLECGPGKPGFPDKPGFIFK